MDSSKLITKAFWRKSPLKDRNETGNNLSIPEAGYFLPPIFHFL